MGIAGTYLLGTLNLLTGLLSVLSILLYAFAYTPLKENHLYLCLWALSPGLSGTDRLCGRAAKRPY